MGCFNYITHPGLIEFAHFLKSFLSLLFTFAGLCLAYKGLQTWRIQLKGTDKYNLAKSVIIKAFEIQELLESINISFLQKGDTQDGAKEYFNHLEYVQNKLIENKAKISFYLLKLKAIDNFEQPAELNDLFNYLKKFNEYYPYITLKKADHLKRQEGYEFLYETDYKTLHEAVKQAIKPFQYILK